MKNKKVIKISLLFGLAFLIFNYSPAIYLRLSTPRTQGGQFFEHYHADVEPEISYKDVIRLKCSDIKFWNKNDKDTFDVYTHTKSNYIHFNFFIDHLYYHFDVKRVSDKFNNSMHVVFLGVSKDKGILPLDRIDRINKDFGVISRHSIVSKFENLVIKQLSAKYYILDSWFDRNPSKVYVGGA